MKCGSYEDEDRKQGILDAKACETIVPTLEWAISILNSELAYQASIHIEIIAAFPILLSSFILLTMVATLPVP
jgi:hypothetical protein